jgi:methylated-DNA-protein-cysteine methyltransferase related protein
MFNKIHSIVRMISKGKVSTYGAVARAAGFPGAARQVVWALRGTSGLPWQRVVAAGGRIALPGEAGFDQRMRLETEGVLFSGSRVRMAECEFVFPQSRPKSRLARSTAKAKTDTTASKSRSAAKKKRVRPKSR